ncbi:MAG: hypothetical protein JSW53_02395, partial [Candidatus Bathyarchaeota archaeon]
MRRTFAGTLLLLIMAIAVLNLLGAARASPTSIEVIPSSLEQEPGDSFLVNITVNDVADLYLWMFRLRWNNTVLQLNSIAEGPFLQVVNETSGIWLSPLTIPEVNAAGRIDEATCSLLGQVPGVDGNGTIATLNFTCLSLGDSALEFWQEPPHHEPATDLLDSNLESITHEATPGVVEVIPEFTSMVLIAVFLLATL